MAGVFPPCGEWTLVYDGHDVAYIRGRRTLLVWTPNIAAIIVLALTGGRKAVTQLLERFLVWRVGVRWWVFAFGLPIVWAIVVFMIFILGGGRIDISRIADWAPVLGLRFLFSLTTGGIGEEAGWRGFALPRLQKRIGPIWASVFIGILWSLWHTAHWSMIELDIFSIFLLYVSMIALSVIFTWTYNSTHGSLLFVALMHTMTNAVEATVSRSFLSIMPGEYFLPLFAALLSVVAFLLMLLTRGNLGLPSDKSS